MKNLLLIFLLCWLTFFQAKTQQTNVFIGTQIPVCYSLGIEKGFSDLVALSLQGGILTSPYDKIILNILKSFGTEDVLVNTVGEAFSHGLVIQVTPTVQTKRWYGGPFYSFFSLVAKDAPADLIENYYGVDIPDRIQSRTRELILTSNLHNAGILIGRKFDLKTKLELRTEISFAKTFNSSSKLSTANYDFENISTSIDEELSKYYKDFGYIPSLNLFLAYKF